MVRDQLGGETWGAALSRWICAGGPNVNPAVAEWARKRIGMAYTWRDFTTMSLWDDGTILAAVIYDGFVGIDVKMHIASGRVNWLDRRFLYAAFAYPFNELKVSRVTGLISATNQKSRKFAESLGFVKEGECRRGSPDGSDLIIYGMLREECRFMEKPYVQA